MIISGVITSLAIFNGVYPAITSGSGAITSASEQVSSRIESRIDIIQVGDNGSDVFVWIKNIGTNEIVGVNRTDVFFGPEGDFYRVANGGGAAPYWEYQIEGGYSNWQQATTLKMTIHPEESLSPGTYIIKTVIPNGVSDQTTYSVE